MRNEMWRFYYLTDGVPKRVDESTEGAPANGSPDLTAEDMRRLDEARGLSVPWWPEAAKWVHEVAGEHVTVPMLFTSQEAAEAQLSSVQRAEADGYLDMLETYGEESTNTALDNTAPPEVRGIDEDLLLSKLEDSDFWYVMVDGKMKLRPDFIEELNDHLATE